MTLIFPRAALASTVTIDSMKEMEAIVSDIDQDTLVVFDVDLTLTVSKTPAYQMPNIKKYGYCLKEYKERWSDEKWIVARNIMSLSPNQNLLDSYTPTLIHSLQHKGIGVMVLTAAITAPLEGPKETADIRAEQLLSVGLDFSQTAPFQQSLVMDTLPKHLGGFPTAKNGIICSNGEPRFSAEASSKGEVLAQFFSLCGWQPKRVIFVDDVMKNIECLVEPMESLGIVYIGVLLKAIDSWEADPCTEEEFVAAWGHLDRRATVVLERMTSFAGP